MLSIWHSNLVYTCFFSMLVSFSYRGILSSSTRRIRWWKLPQCSYHVDFRGHKRLASHKILGISYLETTCLKSAVYYYKVQYKNGGGRHGISVIFLYLGGQRQGGRGGHPNDLEAFSKSICQGVGDLNVRTARSGQKYACEYKCVFTLRFPLLCQQC